MPTAPTVYVVDDDPAIGRALSSSVTKLMGVPVQVFPSAEAFLEFYLEDVPGCLVLDLKMPGMNGLELQERLVALNCRLPVIVISGNAQVTTAVQAMRKGALTLIEKPFELKDLLKEIAAALERDHAQRQAHDQRRAVDERLATLTPKEREVLDCLLQGQSTKQVASHFGTSLATIDKHRWKVLEKMQAESVIELVGLLNRSTL